MDIGMYVYKLSSTNQNEAPLIDPRPDQGFCEGVDCLEGKNYPEKAEECNDMCTVCTAVNYPISWVNCQRVC